MDAYPSPAELRETMHQVTLIWNLTFLAYVILTLSLCIQMGISCARGFRAGLQRGRETIRID